jgi:mannose-6-phosphate isomerase
MSNHPPLYPLRFQPLLKRYLWGGRRLGTELAKPLGEGNDYAESWEICDRATDQSRVINGPLAGQTLHQLVGRYGPELLGRHHPQARFPLLLKFLDARERLSVQVHPNDDQAGRLNPPDLGKTEAWIVLAAEPGSRIYAGLRPGCTRERLQQALAAGRCEECLHSFPASAEDCVFIPAGTVHALGEGLLIAELQQSSDTTFRLFDWNRVGPDGQPRPLHIDRALEVIDFQAGPIRPQTQTCTAQTERLVTCDKFILDRWQFEQVRTLGDDNRCHVVAVLAGAVTVAGSSITLDLSKGDVVLLPASAGAVRFEPRSRAVLLDAYLP